MNTKNTLKKTIKWTGIVLALLCVLLLIATWFVNQEPFQKKIRSAVAQAAGDSVKFQHLNISLFPRPHIIVRNASVNIPGKASASFQSASAYPELWPLLTGKILISKVLFEQPEITVKLYEEPGAAPEAEDARTVFAETREDIESAVETIRGFAPHLFSEVTKGKLVILREDKPFTTVRNINCSLGLLPKGFSIVMTAETPGWGRVSLNGKLLAGKNSIAVRELSLSGGRSSLSGLSARFIWKKTPYLKIRSGQGVVVLADVYERRSMIGTLQDSLHDVKNVKGIVRFSEMSFIGPLLHPDQWKMEMAGEVEDLFLDSGLLPRPVSVVHGRFRANMKSISVTGVNGTFIDSALTTSAELTGWSESIRSVDVTVQGIVGPDTVRWASKTLDIPPEFIVRAPLSFSGIHLIWKPGPVISVFGKAAVKNGPVVSGDLRKNPKELSINRLTIEDREKSATLALLNRGKMLDIAFHGSLNEDTLKRLFEHPSFDLSWVRGDFRAHIQLDNSRESTAQGFLEGGEFVLRREDIPLTLKRIILHANNKTVNVNQASFLLGDSPLDLEGTVKAAADGFRVDMGLDAKSLSIERIKRLFAKKETAGEKHEPSGPLPVQGTIHLNAKEISSGTYTFTPVEANILLDRNSVRIEVADAKLCGISLAGHLQPLDQDLLLDLQPRAVGVPLEPVLDCFSSNKRITGTFSLAGKLHAKGKSGDLVRSLDGSIDFTAKNGKFYTYVLLARVFAFLNLTELLRGKIPDMGVDGFAYTSIKIRGEIKSGKLTLTEAVVEGKTVNLVADGEIDFASNKIDIVILVAPFKTIEYVLSKIPLVRSILANRLITVPVRLTGDLDNPDLTPLDPEAIGENLLNIMKGILEIPFKVLDPLIKGFRKE